MIREKILVIGASGQIGVELTLALRKIYGNANVVASDLREENDLLKGTGPYVSLDVMNAACAGDPSEYYADIFIGCYPFCYRRKES
jgi:nucleoside-diphosphate-sugar epimerase